MKPETISLLCGPGTHEPLRLDSTPGPDGWFQGNWATQRGRAGVTVD